MINSKNSPFFAAGKEKWERFVAQYTGPYDFSESVYAGMNRKVQFVCPDHGRQVSDAKNLIAGKSCQKCSFEARKGRNRITQNKMLERFISVHGEIYDYSKAVYNGQQTPVQIICRTHGSFWQKPEYHWGGSGCPMCAEERRGEGVRDTLSTLTAKVEALFGDLFDLSGNSYTHSQQELSVRCTKHNLVYQTRPNWLLNGHNPCTKCNHMKSTGEDEIAEFLAKFTQVDRHVRNIIAPREIDIWLPAFKIGIEYHGLYWHTADRVGNAHREKWELAQANNARLIQIFEDEWLEKPQIVRNRLLALIGQGNRSDARKCCLKQITAKEGGKFLNETHIQGAGRANLYYGLFASDSLVAVASFGAARSGAMTTGKENGVWEVIRYASKGRVRGGFSRLLKKFKDDVSPTKIVSYCDLRYGNGDVYKAAGFSLEKITEPDYWWYSPKLAKRVPRYQIQKHKMEQHPVLGKYYAKDKTEAQICAEAGWQKILGVGNQKWVMNCAVDTPSSTAYIETVPG